MKIQNIKIIDLILASTIFLLVSCKSDTLHFSNQDETQSITVITDRKQNIRYIINGNVSAVPDTNYVKLDISNIDILGDGVWGCWEKEGYLWEVCVHEAIILESKLDTTKYKFNASLPTREFGIPTEFKYRQDSCFVYGFESGSLLVENYETTIK
jgi:hypothetical protein